MATSTWQFRDGFLKRTGTLALGLSLLGGCARFESDSPVLAPAGPVVPNAESTGPLHGISAISFQEAPREALIGTMCDTEEFHALAEFLRLRSLRASQEEWIAVSAPDLPNSQVHDCQRLVSERSLGPLVALLVNRARVAGEADFRSGAVVADIVNHDSVRGYRWLNIRPGLNCLWLRGDTASNTRWVAVVYQPSFDCASNSTPTAPVVTWEVARHRLEDGTDHYPSTGRWLWDSPNEKQAIGIRCGDAWCEIGPPAFVSTANLLNKDSVPGYYDEQFLSVWDERQNGLRLSRLWGRITPGDSVRAEEDYFWPDTMIYDNRHVATMTFRWDEHRPPPAALRHYRNKFRLNPRETEHRILLRKRLVGGAPLLWVSANHWAHASTVVRSGHKHSGSGTVRWAWHEGDEGTWFACEGGCCKKTDMN